RAIPVLPGFRERLRFHFAGRRFLFDHPQPILQVQFARPAVVIQTESSVRLLLRLDDDRSRLERVHRAARDVNHVSGVYLDPIEKFLGAILLNGSLKLFTSYTRFQTRAELSIRRSVSHVPALSLTPWLADCASIVIVRVHLNR